MPEDESPRDLGIKEGTSASGYTDLRQGLIDLRNFVDAARLDDLDSPTNPDLEEKRVRLLRKLSDTDKSVFKKAIAGENIGLALSLMDSLGELYVHGLDDNYGAKFEEKVLEIIDEDFDVIDRGVKEYSDPVTTVHAINLATMHVASRIDKTGLSETQLRERELNFISNNIGVSLPPDSELKFNASDPVNLILSIGFRDQISKVRDVFVDQAESGDPNIRFGESVFNTVTYLIGSEDSYVSYEAKQIVTEYMDKHWDFDTRSLLNTWYMSNRNYRVWGQNVGERMIMHNFGELYRLEQERPGIGKVLMDEFGIHDFARYPRELLIRQYDERDNKDLSYGVAIYAEDDHNGALYQNEDVLGDLSDQLGEKYILRIYEVGDKKDLVSILNRARKKYGRADFGIIAAHGTEDDMTLGYNTRVNRDDANRVGAHALRNAFVDDPTLILFSCSTGKLGGIGQQIEALGKEGTRVIAPDYVTGPESVMVIKEDGKLNFEVKYRPPKKESEE
ncbi:MAG TPA: hypothetical protein VHE53_03145 [Patescibacteria group bacterium]|nr:hypothetical protein [Patescibacteria group bacterium]